jgi:hypothetical protein
MDFVADTRRWCIAFHDCRCRSTATGLNFRSGTTGREPRIAGPSDKTTALLISLSAFLVISNYDGFAGKAIDLSRP